MAGCRERCPRTEARTHGNCQGTKAPQEWSSPQAACLAGGLARSPPHCLPSANAAALPHCDKRFAGVRISILASGERKGVGIGVYRCCFCTELCFLSQRC